MTKGATVKKKHVAKSPKTQNPSPYTDRSDTQGWSAGRGRGGGEGGKGETDVEYGHPKKLGGRRSHH